VVPVSASRFPGGEDYEDCLLAAVVNHFFTVLSNTAHAANLKVCSASTFVESSRHIQGTVGER